MARSVPASSEANTNFVDLARDAFLRQHLAAIDQKRSLLSDLDFAVRQSLHDSLDLRALRIIGALALYASRYDAASADRVPRGCTLSGIARTRQATFLRQL